MQQNILVTRSSMPPYEEYIEKIKRLWDTHWITNMGFYHQELEKKLKDFLGVEQLSLLVNGHMSLELAIQAMHFPKGSEVITTPFTFISTTHAIVRNNLTPVFCDIKPTDFTIDESKIESLITEKTVAIIPVHVYGNVCNIEAIDVIAEKYGLKVIYDAAHAFGEEYKGEGIADFGDASVFSFHATKVFNTIEGGAVASHSRELYDRLYNLKNFGIQSEEIVEEVGANAKMNEFAAIMGLCNLKYVNDNIKLRREKVFCYIHEFEDIMEISCQKFDDNNIKYNYAYFPVLFESEKKRNFVYDKLKQDHIFTRKYFYPLTSDSLCFKGVYENLPLNIAKDVSSRVLVLPLYPELENVMIKHITLKIKECLLSKNDVYA